MLDHLSSMVVLAHGVQGRADLPIPIEAFFYAAAFVLVVSFAALGLGWKTPRWERSWWRPAPSALERIALSPIAVWAVRAWFFAWFVVVLAACFYGSRDVTSNIAPTAVFVVWWVGLVPMSLLFGNVWAHTSPWTTIATLLRFPRERAGGCVPTFGFLPAVVAFTIWVWLELVYPTAANLELLGVSIVVYSALTLAGMQRYGIDTWNRYGEAFAAYTGVLARLSAVTTRREDTGVRTRLRLGFRPPVVGATEQEAAPWLVPFVGLLIGSVSYDGLSRSQAWKVQSQEWKLALIDGGVTNDTAQHLIGTFGLLLTLVVAVGAFQLAVKFARQAGGRPRKGPVASRFGRRLGDAFAHSLIPIALVYAVAHYFSFFVFQSQDLLRLMSDPFGTGHDYLGTGDRRIDYSLVSADAIWLTQVGAIVAGHVLGLVLAHDRALALFPTHRRALRSQLPMLALMVLYTLAGLYFLSEGMQG